MSKISKISEVLNKLRIEKLSTEVSYGVKYTPKNGFLKIMTILNQDYTTNSYNKFFNDIEENRSKILDYILSKESNMAMLALTMFVKLIKTSTILKYSRDKNITHSHIDTIIQVVELQHNEKLENTPIKYGDLLNSWKEIKNQARRTMHEINQLNPSDRFSKGMFLDNND